MVEKLLMIAVHTLEAMFFIGAIGCALTITVSWAEIFSDGFNDDDTKHHE